MRAIAAASALWCLAGALLAGQPQPEHLPVEVVLAAIHDAYRSAPRAEEVLLKAKDPAGRGRTERYRVFVDASSSRARLELGPLTVALTDGRLVAAHADSESRLVVDSPGSPPQDLLATHLPPVPAPQVDLAFGSGAFSSPTPYSPGVSWHSALAAAPYRGAPVVVTLRGGWDGGDAQAVIDPHRDLLRELTLWIGGENAPSLTLEMRFTPLHPGDPADWEPRTDGRRLVASLQELEPLAQPVRPGEPAPALAMLSADLAPWSLPDEVKSLAEAPGAGLALVFYRDRGGEPEGDANERAAKSAVEALEHPTSPAPDLPEGFVVRFACVLEPGARATERIRIAAERWRTWSPDSPALLWTSSPRHTIDRFDASAAVLIVVADAGGLVRAVVRVDPARAEAGAIAERVRSALLEGR